MGYIREINSTLLIMLSKLLSVVIMSFIVHKCVAQCDYKTETDAITDNKKVWVESGLIGAFGKGMLRFRFAVSSKGTTMLIDVTSSDVFGFEKGDKVIFKGDGGLLELEQATNQSANYTVHEHHTSWSATAATSITKDQIASLVEIKPSVIRIETSKGDFDYLYKEKHTEKLIDILECVRRVIPE